MLLHGAVEHGYFPVVHLQRVEVVVALLILILILDPKCRASFPVVRERHPEIHLAELVAVHVVAVRLAAQVGGDLDPQRRWKLKMEFDFPIFTLTQQQLLQFWQHHTYHELYAKWISSPILVFKRIRHDCI